MGRPKKVITEYRNYFLQLQFPLVLLTGDHWRISDVRSDRLHFHNCLEIGYCHSDSGYLELYGDPLPFEQGDITVIPRNVPHTTYSTEGVESRWTYLFFDPKAMLSLYLPPTWNNYDLLPFDFKNFRYIFNKKEFPQLYHLLSLVIEELKEQKAEYEISVRALLCSLYIEIYRLQSKQADETNLEGDRGGVHRTVNPLVISPALEFIEEQYSQQFTTDDLADLCHWSPTHFRRVFSEIMGTSPLKYVNNTRILKSCHLLCNTEESILNISHMVGFQSVSSYNRAFNKVMQVSPRDYRRQMLQSDKLESNQTILEFTGWTEPEKLRNGSEHLSHA